MSNNVPFDTLAYAKKLEARGVEPKQAEAHAESLAEVLETNFLTKKDSDSAIDNLLQEMVSFKIEIRQEIASFRQEMAAFKAEMHQEMALFKSEIRQEMASFKGEMRSDMAALRAEVKSDIAALKAEIIKWVFGVSFVQAAFIISVLKFLHVP